MTTEYALISQGRKGTFTILVPALEDAIAKGKEELLSGQECAIYIKHSDLAIPPVEVKKTDRQKEAEAAIVAKNQQ